MNNVESCIWIVKHIGAFFFKKKQGNYKKKKSLFLILWNKEDEPTLRPYSPTWKEWMTCCDLYITPTWLDTNVINFFAQS